MSIFPVYNFLEIGLFLTGTDKRSLYFFLLKAFYLLFNQLDTNGEITNTTAV